MWGNLRGWVISAVMMGAAVIMLWAIALPPQESSKAGLLPLAFKPVALPVSPDTVRPAGTNDCDAGVAYRKAIEEYLKDPAPYATAAQVDIAQLPALASVVEGTDCAHMHLFDVNPTQAISYDGKKPWIDAMMALGQAVNTRALGLFLKDETQEAEKYWSAGFALGRKMVEERVTWDELNKGLSIMAMAADGMTEMANKKGDTARVNTLQKFSEATKNYQSELQDKVGSPISNPVESYSAKYAGDIFAVAKDTNVERLWRVEAILHLGHYRWNVTDEHKGDQGWAQRELQKLEKSTDPKNTDPVIKAAVQAAENLTVEQQRMIGN